MINIQRNDNDNDVVENEIGVTKMIFLSPESQQIFRSFAIFRLGKWTNKQKKNTKADKKALNLCCVDEAIFLSIGLMVVATADRQCVCYFDFHFCCRFIRWHSAQIYATIAVGSESDG